MRVATTRDWNVIAKVAMGLAVPCLVVGAVFAVRTRSFLQRAVPAVGTIVELVERGDDDGGTLYAPVFVFEDASGEVHKVYSSTASYPPIGSVGDEVRILYDPQNSRRARRDTLFALWGIATVSAGIGVFELVLWGAVAFFTGRKLRAGRQAAEAAG